MNSNEPTSPTSPPSVRPPGCDALAYIGHDRAYGFCTAHEHHVSLETADACLCDHCTQDPDGKRNVDPDVYFYGHDLVGLRATRQAELEQAITVAAAIPCAPRVEKPLPATTPKAKAKPAPPRKQGLLAFS